MKTRDTKSGPDDAPAPHDEQIHQETSGHSFLRRARSFVSLHPSYTRLRITYSVYCRHRYHYAGVAQRKQFMRELRIFERLQAQALDGVRVHREFSQGVLSHKIPRPRYMNKLLPDPLTPAERTRLNNILESRGVF